MRRILQSVGSKWTVLVVSQLNLGPKRFSELRRAIGGITQKSLTATLRELEKDGLVHRIVTPTIPPRVDYRLTPLGQSLTVPLDALTNWAVENEAAVSEAQSRFEAAQHQSA
ncbi:MAG: helix-turn-helix domain-containing protein [Acuticoccus sp.]